MDYTADEVLQTIRMVATEHVDVRTVTLGVSLFGCRRGSISESIEAVSRRVREAARHLVPTAALVEKEFGVPIINKRIAVSPVAMALAFPDPEAYVELAQALDLAALDLGIDFIGGMAAFAQKRIDTPARALMDALPTVLSTTERVCGAVGVASTRTGINMDAVVRMAEVIHDAAFATADRAGVGAAKLVVYCNPVGDNPFMAGAFHGPEEGEMAINVGVSGPGAVLAAVRDRPRASFTDLAEVIKHTAFKITRVGELVGQEIARRLDIPFGIVDLSLAPTNTPDDSVAQILEAFGIERVGAPGTVMALALLNDAVKKGGAMATSSAGGLSGSFIPVSEDAGMIQGVECGSLTLDKLEAMTAVCSVGIDMVAIPGDTPVSTLVGIIADEMAIGMINRKTTAVRVIPVPGRDAGSRVAFGGLLGEAPVMHVTAFSSEGIAARGGRVPAPLAALNN